MSTIKLLSVASFASMLALATTRAEARDPRDSDKDTCVFGRYAPVSVVAYVPPVDHGGGVELAAYSPIAGAQLYVPAQEGMSAEWLTAQLQRALAHNDAARGSCGPHVGEVRVNTVAAGGGYWVTLVSADAQKAATLLEWARGLVSATR